MSNAPFAFLTSRLGASSLKCYLPEFASPFYFRDSIGKVQENTEFYWRYQRYSFVRDYFERVPLAYPPLIIFSHIFLLSRALVRKCCGKHCRNRVGENDRTPASRCFTPVFSE